MVLIVNLYFTFLYFRELQEKEQKKSNFNAGLEELRVAQELWKENHRKEIEAENDRIAKFIVEREKKMDEQKRLNIEKKQSSSKFSDRMCAELLENEVSPESFNSSLELANCMRKRRQVSVNRGPVR